MRRSLGYGELQLSLPGFHTSLNAQAMLAGSSTSLTLPTSSYVFVTSVLGDVTIQAVLMLLVQVQQASAVTVVVSAIGGGEQRTSVSDA